MDHPSLPQLLDQNGPFVRALARSLVQDPGLAEDLAQETWLRFLRKPPAATGSLRHGLRTVARNPEVDTDERGTYQGPLFPGNYDLVSSNRAQPSEDLVVPIVVQSARATVLTVSLDRP